MESNISVLIPDSESAYAILAAHCLQNVPGVRIHVLTRDRWAPLRFSRCTRSYCFESAEIETDAYFETVVKTIKKEKIDLILPVGTQGISFVISRRKDLAGLVALPPLPDQKSFEIANNKWLLAQFLRENGLPGPNTLLVEPGNYFKEQLQEFQFPVLFKPVDAGGGRGILRFEILAELKSYLEPRMYGKFIVQEILHGRVVGLNFLAKEGVVLAKNIQRELIPNRNKYASAAAVEFFKNDEFAFQIERLVQKINWSGFANIDTLCDQENELQILDFNARFWGSLAGSFISGVNFPYLACLAAMNKPFPPPDYESLRYFHPLTGIREGLKNLIGKSSQKDISFREIGLHSLLNDPLGEIVRVVKQ